MAEILDVVLKILIVLFMVGNMAGMGAQLAISETLVALRNVRFILMTVVWGWVLCPSFAYLLVKIIPMEQPYAIGLILVGMTPCAPFMPMMVRKARGDLGYTGALMLLAALGTVAFMPFAVPRMVTGLTADAWVIGRPLLFFVLVPLLVGMAVKRCAEPVASRYYPLVKKTTDITTMVMLAVMAIVYGKDFIGAIGSYAIGTLILFVGVVTLATDRLGFGLEQGLHFLLELKREATNRGTDEETTKTQVKIDFLLDRVVSLLRLEVPFPDEKTSFGGDPFSPHLGDNRVRYRVRRQRANRGLKSNEVMRDRKAGTQKELHS